MFNLKMSLRPSILLSKAARSRFVASLKKIPALVDMNVAEADRIYASVLVPLCVHNGELCLLYTLRSMALTNHSGQVSFPGGKRDPHETVVDTALRETEEEIGFPRENVDIWTVMSYFQGRNKKMFTTPVVGQLLNFDFNKLVKNDDEVEEIFTVSMEHLCNGDNHAHFVWKTLTVPVFLCGKHKLIGITAIITRAFLQIFLSEDQYKPNFLRQLFQRNELLPSKI